MDGKDSKSSYSKPCNKAISRYNILVLILCCLKWLYRSIVCWYQYELHPKKSAHGLHFWCKMGINQFYPSYNKQLPTSTLTHHWASMFLLYLSTTYLTYIDITNKNHFFHRNRRFTNERKYLHSITGKWISLFKGVQDKFWQPHLVPQAWAFIYFQFP